MCEFRVVQWNAAGLDTKWGNYHQPIKIADTVIDYVNQIDANVVTLQEIEPATVAHLESELPGWTCHAFPVGADEVAVCVDGPASNFASVDLGIYDGLVPDPPWWGYAQLEYRGTLITSVHTRKAWRHEHVRDLHRDVPSGILGGDFNFADPEVAPVIDPGDEGLPVWFETDLDHEWTWEGDWANDGVYIQIKIDHVLSVEEPAYVWGDAADKEGSNHRVLLGEVIYPRVGPEITVAASNPTQPIEVDAGCAATVEFEITIHDGCCLDPDALGLSVAATNPTADATLGAVVIDHVVPLGLRDAEVFGHVEVSALERCEAEVVIDAEAQDCAANVGYSAAQGTSASLLVVDTTPPDVAAWDGELACLWPPNHEYVCFDAGEFAPGVADNCAVAPPSWAFTSCTSSQPDDGVGDGHTVDDCIITAGGLGFCARSERTGSLPEDRLYATGIVATDACGNTSAETGIGTVRVPHDARPGGTCVDPAGR